MNLRVLLIESEPDELLFLHDVLREIEDGRWLPEWPQIELLSAATLQAAAEILATVSPHAIFLDLDLADRQGTGTFRFVQEAAPDIPIILVMNSGDDAMAAKLMRDGAEDFLFKKQIDCAPMAHALRNAVLRHRLLAAARATARTDSLTGLSNRAGFFASAGRDRKLAERLDRRWMLLVARPKSLTGTGGAFGEQRRDLELVEAADHLRGLVTPADALARIGDCHFAISIFDSGAESVEEAWMRISNAATVRGVELGASIFSRDNPLSLDAMLEQALADLPQRSKLAGVA
jgi:PleD family two-component response regulator